MELLEDFQVQIPQTNLDKIMAAALLITSDDFYKNLPKFIEICNILADNEFNPEVFDPADPFEIAWGMTEAMLLSPPDEDEPFSTEIRYYIGKACQNEGLTTPPDILRIGLTDGNDPLAESADDPTLYSAFFQHQQNRSAEIVDTVREHITGLFNQLESLQLKTGNVKDLLKKLQGVGVSS
jgi:hypothetical protein